MIHYSGPHHCPQTCDMSRLNILERDGYVLEWVRFSPQLNIMDALVMHWNGLGLVPLLLPLNILERDSYVLEWVWFSPQLNIMGRLVTYWNGFGSLPN